MLIAEWDGVHPFPHGSRGMQFEAFVAKVGTRYNHRTRAHDDIIVIAMMMSSCALVG